jgi:CopG family transcriptional regulator/antitoxin EndoAI
MCIASNMGKRINIVLAESTIRTIGRLAKPGERSRFIDRAVQHYVATQSAEALRKRLEEAAVRDRDLDRQVADEWLPVDQEIWRRLDDSEQYPKPTTRGAAKSTSRRSTRR